MKQIINKAGCLILKRAAGAVTKYDKNCSDEASAWPDNFLIELVVFSENTKVAFIKNGKYLSGIKNNKKEPDLKIIVKDTLLFKKMILAELSLADAYTQNRVIVEGRIMDAMRFVRIMNIIMSYLYPRFLLMKIMNTLPLRSFERFKNKIKIIINGIILGAL